MIPSRLSRLYAWMGRHRTVLVDGVVALALMGLWALYGPGFLNETGLLFSWPSHATMAWSILLTAPYALHRVRPRLAVRLFLVVAVAQLVVGPSLAVADVMALPMLYAALVYGPVALTRRYLLWAVVLDAVASLEVAMSNFMTPLSDFLRGLHDGMGTVSSCGWNADGLVVTSGCAVNVVAEFLGMAVFFGIALTMVAVAAFWQRARRQTVLLLTQRNEAIEARQAEERRIAASAERARIARDMHDVVAHTLSIIIVQADGGRYATVHDPQMACETMETIRSESEHALHDMKRLLGVFGGSPRAGAAQLPLLLDQARQASPDTAFSHEAEGTPQPQRLSQEADTALYHVVQEALTNIRKYAGRHVYVQVRECWDDVGVTVTVADDGRGAAAALDGHSPGFGLAGMRERVEAAGGTVAAGPAIGGGFTVTAHLPYGSDEPGRARAVAPSPAAVSAPVADRQQEAVADDPVAAAATDDDAAAPQVRQEAASPQEEHRWTQWVAQLRSQPFAQARDDDHDNWVTRLSRWTERHYVLADTIMVAFLTAFLLVHDLSLFLVVDPDQASGQGRWMVAVTLLLMAPLCLRRRFPRAVAVCFAAVVALQLLVLPGVYTADVFALLAIYTASLYGRGRTWRWLVPTILALSALTGVKVALSEYGYATVLDRLLGRRFASVLYDHVDMQAYMDAAMARNSGISIGLAAAMACMIALLLGAWAKQRGENPQILQARAEAMQAEVDKQRIAAANRERDRISAEIQQEVSDTLRMVIDQTSAELEEIHGQLGRGRTPTPESIGDAFAAIAARGRAALARMRTLLKVLRETGTSDDHEDTDRHLTMPLSPVAGTRDTADR
ncbi:DUF7134 domain-containing protein [Bifidobacterium cuniculi]|nr:histidine kinase [Bifidobacterium cuniculi]